MSYGLLFIGHTNLLDLLEYPLSYIHRALLLVGMALSGPRSKYIGPTRLYPPAGTWSTWSTYIAYY